MVDMQEKAKRPRRTGVTVGALAMIAALLVPAPALAGHYTNTTELSATTNTGAAAAWSRATFPTTAPEVLLGRDDLFADSLASGSMQGTRPLLLTNSQTLSPDANTELNRLRPSVVNIMGGASAVSTAIENDLKTRGYTVRRFSGPTRVETAIDVTRRNHQTATSAILAAAFAPAGGDPTRAFADSIAAGGWAAGSTLPVLLTETERLTTSTKNYLRGSLIRSVFVVGGASAVSDATVQELQQIGMTVKRVSGPTRFDTAVRIAQERGFADAAKSSEVILTEGQAADSWAAGFAAAAYAKAKNAPIVLANGANIPAPTQTYLAPPGGAAGTKLLCGPRMQSSACDAASTAMGHTPVTGSAPWLLSATVAVSATVGESEVHLRFSEPVAQTVVADRIKGYTFDAIPVAVSSAGLDQSKPDTVVVRFPTSAFGELTTIGVAYDAVRSATTAVQGIEGSAGIQRVVRAAGNTRGPNLSSIALTSVDINSATSTATVTASFAWDKAVAACGPSASYQLVRTVADPDDQTRLDVVSALDVDSVVGQPTRCTAEFTVPVAAGDDATDVSDKIARGFVKQDAVEVTGLGGVPYKNPPTSAELRSTSAPEITGYTVDTAQSQVTFEFDQAVDAVNAGTTAVPNFKVFDSRRTIIPATSATLLTTSPTNTTTTKVVATFDATWAGFLRNPIVGVALEAGAVKGFPDTSSGTGGLTDPGRFNGPQEFGKSVAFEAGRTSGPTLTKVTRGNAPGGSGTRVTFTFAETVDESTGGFFVYGDDGARTALAESDCGIDPSDLKKIHCDVAANAASNAAVRGAVYGAAAREAVRPSGQGTLTGAVSPNAEASLAITS